MIEQDRYITVSDGLWIDLEGSLYDGLFKVCDGVGGYTLVDVDEIPALIEVLRSILEQHGTSSESGEKGGTPIN